MDITQLILDDHHEQRRLFAIIEQLEPTDTVALGALWGRLAAFLEVHAEAEERFFYPALLRVGQGPDGESEPTEETVDAIRDHNDIRTAVAKAASLPIGSKEWYEAVASANKANGDHMAEEEREGLTDFRRTATLEMRHRLAVQFATFEAVHHAGVEAVNKQPQAYVDSNK